MAGRGRRGPTTQQLLSPIYNKNKIKSDTISPPKLPRRVVSSRVKKNGNSIVSYKNSFSQVAFKNIEAVARRHWRRWRRRCVHFNTATVHRADRTGLFHCAFSRSFQFGLSSTWHRFSSWVRVCASVSLLEDANLLFQSLMGGLNTFQTNATTEFLF